ncbi:Tousled-like protein kinase [Ectocarpus siliculosus]|uniref:Tousled-like protein kinase n=1 Tax=Ectocarpus siliculosus TaxID=2880 RepID=D7FVD8_ECTSI|nr:Tousled-like protein kinase [Ectocarpus siliculosus]|eukprot:CBJ26310.1 Tousled-like protein kinase [Ectocarpus siliculosus]
MEFSGLAMDNFPAIAANDSKTLRKLSLLEARMVGAGNESRDASLPPNEGSRGSENNSNSMSTIGFAKPRASAISPGGGGGGGGSKPPTDPIKDGSGGKRKAAAEADGFSPPRPPSHSQNAGTPSTLSTSPGEGGDWNSARQASQGAGDDGPGLKRARTGGTLQPPPPPPPPRFSLPQGEGNHQPARAPATGTGTGAVPGGAKGGQFHARRGSRGAEGTSFPSNNQAPGKSGGRASSDRTNHRSDHPDGSKQHQTVAGADFSPPSAERSGKGSGQAPPVAASKTIQSYFFKPSNGTAVQNLAASYGAGEVAAGQMRAASGLPQEVDLSGADGDSYRGEPTFAQPIARIGRSGSTGTVRGGDGRAPHHRLSHTAPSAGDQGVDQAQQVNAQSRGQAVDPAGGGMERAAGANTGMAGSEQESLEKLHDRLREAKSVERELRNELARANLERGSMETMADSLRSQLERTMDEFKAKETDEEAQKKQLTSVVEGLLRKVAAQEASDSRATLTRDMLDLGKIVSVKTGHIGKYVEAFEEGTSFKEVEKKTAAMMSRKTKLEARKRAVSKLLRSTAPAAGDGSFSGQARLEAIEEEETVRMHLTALKREEVALQEEKRALDARKVLHIRELKRVAHEDRSKFAKRPTLNGRYVLLNLLGKGGFSEVWRAFDLVHAEDVAVKVHQLLNNWNEPQKANFIRHVTREYEIHQQMRHPRIVNLTDVFEICCDSFATVLDYCRGTDLECLLRERKQLPERDARALVLQVARGLQYLNTAQGEGESRRGAIIHYDLKPGNILLDENGDVKITDFGLSKILEIKKDTERGTGGGTSMELTSKGAGTYWYLPPECFGDNPRISSKVDVWSLGVIFYQILYGVRPFGEGLSQEKILREKVIVNANRVDFPPKPVVSEEAKSFIRSCLTYTHATRPDVHAMCNLPYLTTPAARRGG